MGPTIVVGQTNISLSISVLLSFSRSATRAFRRGRRSSHADRVGPRISEYVGDDRAWKIAFLFACEEHEIRPRCHAIGSFKRAAFEPALRAVEIEFQSREQAPAHPLVRRAINPFDRRTDFARGLPRCIEERALERTVCAKPRFFRTPDAFRTLRRVRRHPVRARAAARPPIARAACIEIGLSGSQARHDRREIIRFLKFPCALRVVNAADRA